MHSFEEGLKGFMEYQSRKRLRGEFRGAYSSKWSKEGFRMFMMY
jgi:hypothetical protein